MGKLMTVRETATALRVSNKQVYSLLHENAMPHLRIGGAIRVREADVETYLRRCYRGGPESPTQTATRAA